MLVLITGWRAATQAWVEELVVGQGLCPWASSARIRYRSAASVDRMESLVAAEAASLLDLSSPLVTTLIVLDTDLDISSFAAATSKASTALPPGLELLAFHPHRLDVGPGCSTDFFDAAHFSVRSPLPTLQLLRSADVERARAEFFAGASARVNARAMPGALSLLFQNKRKLRRIGAAPLQKALEAWRAQWASDSTKS